MNRWTGRYFGILTLVDLRKVAGNLLYSGYKLEVPARMTQMKSQWERAMIQQLAYSSDVQSISR